MTSFDFKRQLEFLDLRVLVLNTCRYLLKLWQPCQVINEKTRKSLMAIYKAFLRPLID